jgi:hypothetical protein
MQTKQCFVLLRLHACVHAFVFCVCVCGSVCVCVLTRFQDTILQEQPLHECVCVCVCASVCVCALTRAQNAILQEQRFRNIQTISNHEHIEELFGQLPAVEGDAEDNQHDCGVVCCVLCVVCL